MFLGGIEREPVAWNGLIPLREKCQNSELTPYLDTFHAVYI